MRDIVKFFDGLPWIVKLILALPGLDGICWGIYRVAKGYSRKDNVMLIVGIIWIFAGIFFLWIIDMITIIVSNRPTVFA